MPIWTYGIQLWATTNASNKDLLQRAQSKILRIVTNAPWYIRNSNIHADLVVPSIENVTKAFCRKYKNRLECHPNVLANKLLIESNFKRLKRKAPLDLLN